jgi:acetoin utilization protein AcuC
MMRPPVFLPEGAVAYDFGPRHPLRPERYAATRRLLTSVWPEADVRDAPPASLEHALLVHSPAFVEAVQSLSRDPSDRALAGRYGFASGDNPAFAGMWEASLAYLGGTVAAVEAVLDGAPLAFNWTGGLHHASRGRASGFCVLNDAAAACALLRARFPRVAYVDIDLHHGDGVQEIWLDDPCVLTYSIHESGETLFPGTGWLHETGVRGTSTNLPLAAGTSGDVWLDAFAQTALPTLERFRPGAIVLQAGCDAHRDDPLGHLEASVQDYLAAVRLVGGIGAPLVVLGGGGYSARHVPRMWTAATLALCGHGTDAAEHALGDDLAGWARGRGRALAMEAVAEFQGRVLPGVPTPGAA